MYDYNVLIKRKDQNLFHHATNVLNSDDLTSSVLNRVGREKEKDNLRVDVLLPPFQEFVTLDSSVFANCMSNNMTIRVVEKSTNEIVSAANQSSVVNTRFPKVCKIILAESSSSDSDEFEVCINSNKSKRKPRVQEIPNKRRRRSVYHHERKVVTFSTTSQSFKSTSRTHIIDQRCSGYDFNISLFPRGKGNCTNTGIYVKCPSVKIDHTLHVELKLWVLYPNNKHKLLVFHKHLHLKAPSRYGGNTSIKFDEIEEFIDDDQINWCAEISKVQVSTCGDADCTCSPIKCCCGTNKALKA
jgi:hypothetical protein